MFVANERCAATTSESLCSRHLPLARRAANVSSAALLIDVGEFLVLAVVLVLPVVVCDVGRLIVSLARGGIVLSSKRDTRSRNSSIPALHLESDQAPVRGLRAIVRDPSSRNLAHLTSHFTPQTNPPPPDLRSHRPYTLLRHHTYLRRSSSMR